MKLSKIVLIAALLGIASLASAGPCTGNPYNCNTTSEVPATLFGGSDMVGQTNWTDGFSYIQTGLVFFTNGSDGPQSVVDPNPSGFYTDAFPGSPSFGFIDGSTSLPFATASTISNNAQFSFDLNQFIDPNPFASGGDSFDAFVVPNIPNLSDALTSGTGTYFEQTYGADSGYGIVTNYFELDVTLAATPANSYAQSDPRYDPGTPAGIFRIGFGMNVTDCIESVCTPYGGTATVTAVLLPGLQDVATTFGDFVVLGNLTGCTGGEGSCVAQLLYTDAEFDAFPTTTPEPTTLLLLGSGLLGLARRFRR